MHRDPTQFRERFKRWKAGLPAYKNGKSIDDEELAVKDNNNIYFGGNALGEGNELVVTGRKPSIYQLMAVQHAKAGGYRSAFDGNAVKDALGLVPIVSDVMDGVDAAKEAVQGNYTSAAMLGAGLLMPNVLEKPAKALRKVHRQFNYLDPSSLLNTNIRRALANEKRPVGYDLFDKNNYLPFIHGLLSTIKGKRILLRPMSDFNGVWNNNRLVAWRKYLGLGDYNLVDQSPTSLIGTRSIGKYVEVPGKSGHYIANITKNQADRLKRDVRSAIEHNGEFRDNALGAHGQMGYGTPIKSTPNETQLNTINSVPSLKRRYESGEFGTYDVPYFDTWDLQPLKAFGFLPKRLRNFEVSSIIPGAKPFTWEGVLKNVPIRKD